jgi:hypothetical protein
VLSPLAVLTLYRGVNAVRDSVDQGGDVHAALRGLTAVIDSLADFLPRPLPTGNTTGQAAPAAPDNRLRAVQ